MIKIELVKNEGGVDSLFFQSNKPEDQAEIDMLDRILELLVGPFPRRGAYIVGSPDVLKIDVNTK